MTGLYIIDTGITHAVTTAQYDAIRGSSVLCPVTALVKLINTGEL